MSEPPDSMLITVTSALCGKVPVDMENDANLHTVHERTVSVATDALPLACEDSDNVGMQIGKIIRTLRQEQGLTLEELALRIGSDAGNLSRVERGKQRYTPEMLQAIAEALKTPVSYLFIRAEQKLAAYQAPGRKAHEHLRGTGPNEFFLSLRRVLSQLDADQQKLVIEFARMLSRQNKSDKSGPEV